MDKNVLVKFLNQKDELYQITWDLYPHEIEPILKKISDLQWEVERIIYKKDAQRKGPKDVQKNLKHEHFNKC